MQRLVLCIVWIFGLLSLPAQAGCGYTDSHIKQLDVINGMAASVTSRMADGALAQMQASGQGIEPGITTRAYVMYGADAYFKGLAGQFAVASQGELGPDSHAEQVAAILRDKSLSDEQRRTALERLMQGLLDRRREEAAP